MPWRGAESPRAPAGQTPTSRRNVLRRCRALTPSSAASSVTRIVSSAPASMRPIARFDQRVGGVRGSASWRELRPAAKTRPEARLLGLRGEPEELAPPARGRPRGADRPTIDPRRAHPDEEPTVETTIARGERTVAGVGLDHRVLFLRCSTPERSPQTDLTATPTAVIAQGTTIILRAQTRWIVGSVAFSAPSISKRVPR